MIELFDEADRAAWTRLVGRVGVAAIAPALAPRALASVMLADTAFAAAALETLRDPASAAAQAVTAAFPEAAALAAPMAAQVEHDVGSDRPLLDHIATRLLGVKLRALETRDRAAFHGGGAPVLSEEAFVRLADTTARVIAAGLGPALRAAILHLDIAKTPSAVHREAWARLGLTLEIHNEASAAVLRATGRATAWPLSSAHAALALAWTEGHGLAGQHVRGEGPLAMFAPALVALQAAAHPLALDGLHVINACDTAACREGLLDDALLGALARVRDELAAVLSPHPQPLPVVEAALVAREPAPSRATLVTRLLALRAGRQRAGEPAAAVEAAVAAIGAEELAALLPALAMCQLWYCESATSGLSPAAQLGVLAAAVGAARAIGVDVTRPWHAQLRPLVSRLHGDSAAVRYRLRLVEAALAGTTMRTLLTGNAKLGPLGTLSARLAHAADPDTIVVDYADTEESAALVTLLGTYETRDSIAYHAMLKSLCDLYGLRKDEFDRVANEANYLATMNAARSDKERMLDYVVPGTLLEVGPGGGVVLDLLEHRFPSSRVIGVDLSREVVAALEQRARTTGKRWSVVLGAAEQLPTFISEPVHTIVFCSILHEVYSYTEPRFQLASVERVIAAAFAALAPGGRIVIRDGVMPPPGRRRIRFLAADVAPTLALYVAQFEGRPIRVTPLASDRVELSTADAMEFLYTYTWGPASFPYEVRELYGILPYDEYVASLVRWCGGPDRALVVDNPLRSYLQPGYRDNLRAKIELTDEHDRPVELPDSNCLIVIEKR